MPFLPPPPPMHARDAAIERPAHVMVVPERDVTWGRKIFRAPELDLQVAQAAEVVDKSFFGTKSFSGSKRSS